METFWYAFMGAFFGAVAAVFLFAGAFVWWDTRDERSEARDRKAGRPVLRS